MKMKNRIFIAVLSLFVGAQIYGAQMNLEELVIDRNFALYCAVRSGDIQQVQEALDAGAYVNWQVTQEVVDRFFDDQLVWLDPGNSPLHFAVAQNNLEMVRLLLERGADVNLINRNGWTSLLLAVCRNAVGRNNLEMVRLLLDNNADVNIVTGYGSTPLSIVVDGNNLEMAQFLLDHHADPNTIHHQRTLLGMAIDRDNVAMVQVLMNSGRLDQGMVNAEILRLEEERDIAFQAGQDWPEIKHQILNTLTAPNYI